nr:MAG TPA: putative receptor binding protein [Herelleviridae sp.]
MALTFTTITDKSTIKDLTMQVNNIGEELTKGRNIFDITNEIQKNMLNVQKSRITQDTGVAKLKGNVTSLKDLKELGYFYINPKAFSQMQDKPQVATLPVILNNIPSYSSELIIQYLYTLSLNDTDIKTYFRYVNGNTSSQWQQLQALPEGKNRILNYYDVDTIEEVGNFYVINASNLPEGLSEGFLHVVNASNDSRKLEFVDVNTGKKYHKVKRNNQAYGDWQKEVEPTDLQQYLITKIQEDGEGSINMRVYKSDNLSFPQAMEKHMKETKQNNFTFYVQGGVPESPSNTSLRGMFVAEQTYKSSDIPLYGVYWGISNDGRIVTGGVNNHVWTKSNVGLDAKVLWTGAHSFTDKKKTEKMTDEIGKYDYVKIYTKVQGNDSSTTAVNNTVNNKAHDFFRDGNSHFVCTGIILEATPPIADYYRVGVQFNGDTFKVSHSNVSNSKTQYITRIVGYNVME